MTHRWSNAFVPPWECSALTKNVPLLFFLHKTEFKSNDISCLITDFGFNGQFLASVWSSVIAKITGPYALT